MKLLSKIDFQVQELQAIDLKQLSLLSWYAIAIPYLANSWILLSNNSIHQQKLAIVGNPSRNS